jgi:uncharacterized integral membrane protein
LHLRLSHGSWRARSRPSPPAQPPRASYTRTVHLPGRKRLDTEELEEAWQPKLYGRLIALGLVAAYAIAFVLENRSSVHIHFVFATTSVSLIWLVLLALALGVAGGMLLAQLDRRRRRRRTAQ